MMQLALTTPRQPYPSDLSDAGWKILEPLLPPEKPSGRHRGYALREIINGIEYLIRVGGAWRSLPHDLPHWQSVYHYFRLWKRDGTWLRIHDHLHEEVRRQMGRDPQPFGRRHRLAVGEDDGKGGLHGYDRAKKIGGRKRHILVDTTGLLINGIVHSAAVMDRDGAFFVLGAAYGVCDRLKLIWADIGYRGERLKKWIKQEL